MPPASKDRPSDLTHIAHPLMTNPENTLGYIFIHKCGINTYARHLQASGWNRSWMNGMKTSKGYQPNPRPGKVLVIVRDPVDRYVSGMMQVGGSAYNEQVAQNVISHIDTLYTKERNQHVWPFTWFLAEWGRFADRMEFVDVKDAADWFVSNGVELPPEGDRHRNASYRPDVQRLKDKIFSDERVLPRIQEYYTHDYDLLDSNGLVYPR